jgi:Domain of unknown function (DUF4209)
MSAMGETDDLHRAISAMIDESAFPYLAARIPLEEPELGVLLYEQLFESRGNLRQKNGGTVSAQQDQWTARLLHIVGRLSHGFDGFHVVEGNREKGTKLSDGGDDLPPEAYGVFLAQASDPTLPLQLRAIFYQALWELKTRWGHLRLANPMDIVDLAIKTHLDSANQMGESTLDPLTKGMCVAQHWKTALQLAMTVGRLQHIKDNLQYLRTLATNIVGPAPHWALNLYSIELDAAERKGVRQHDLVSDDRLNSILTELDNINARLASMGGMIHMQRDLVDIRGNAERLLGRPQDQRTQAERLARLHQQNAESASSGILAHMNWKEAAAQYFQAGLKEDGNRALAESREALSSAQKAGEFREINTPIPLTEEKLQELVDPYFVNAPDAGTILDRIAAKLFAPSLEKDSPSPGMPKSILSQIAPTMPVVDDRSLATLAPGSEEQQAFEKHQAQQFEVSFYSATLLCGIMSRLRETLRPTPDEFASWLGKSPAVSEEEAIFYRLSFQHYLNADNVSAMHVLIPRIEQMVRWTLRNAGAKATALRSDEVRERPLGELLREAEASSVLSRPVVRLLQVVLSEEWGMNLRNRVAHGFATPGDFTQEKMERIVHIALLIARTATSTANS